MQFKPYLRENQPTMIRTPTSKVQGNCNDFPKPDKSWRNWRLNAFAHRLIFGLSHPGDAITSFKGRVCHAFARKSPDTLWNLKLLSWRQCNLALAGFSGGGPVMACRQFPWTGWFIAGLLADNTNGNPSRINLKICQNILAWLGGKTFALI